MADLAIVNASPLILLAKAERLDLLRLAADQILVPRPVANEVREYRHGAGAKAIDATEWLTLVEAEPVPPAVLAWDLGSGESAGLACALARPGCDVVIDDLAGRRCAAALEIPVRGTLGLVLTAKQRGVIGAARPVVEQLRRAGMYLSDRVVDEALSLVGE